MFETRGAITAACLTACLWLPGCSGDASRASVADPCLPAVRRFVEMQQRGTPDYVAMAPGLRALARQQSGRLQAGLGRLGKLQALALLRTDGAERIYEVWFEHGRMLWGLTLSPTGPVCACARRLA